MGGTGGGASALRGVDVASLGTTASHVVAASVSGSSSFSAIDGTAPPMSDDSERAESGDRS